MIDYSPQIFSAVAIPLRNEFKGIRVTNELSDLAPVLPCVQIEESTNIPTDQDNGDTSDRAFLQYRIRVITGKNDGRISEARHILAFIDSILEPLNLRRKTYVPQSGLYNNSTYRIDTTYEAAITANGQLMRR